MGQREFWYSKSMDYKNINEYNRDDVKSVEDPNNSLGDFDVEYHIEEEAGNGEKPYSTEKTKHESLKTSEMF
jgi:hypothetical protein